MGNCSGKNMAIAKKLFMVGVFLLLFSFIGAAKEEHDFAEAELLIQQKVPCGDLTENQLELIGDYYMEQMHPGEAHEIMDEMMGGEGSEQLRQVHINLARNFYCGDRTTFSAGMMNTMMGRAWNQNYYPRRSMMFGYGMMGSGLNNPLYSGRNMMGSGFWGMGWSTVFYVILVAFIFAVVFLLVNQSKKR